MYTKIRFGIELKERLSHKETIVNISLWAYEIFLAYSDIFDKDFLDLLITLSTMELGPEFAFSYETLNEISDDLISGKSVDPNLTKYRERDA